MTRYFFDVASNACVYCDHRGRELERPDQARALAELIALDLECIDGDELWGAEVQVRNLSGDRLYSVPIREPDLIAA